jgi:ornithine decarboxylase
VTRAAPDAAALRRFASPESVVEALQPSRPVYCVRPAAIRDAASCFVDHFPGDVLYAVKCNPGAHMLRELFAAGIRHFDTASLWEIERVADLLPQSGEDACQSYFMHPVKSRKAIRSAWQVHGVRHYVIDHANELAKIADLVPPNPDVVIVVRLGVHHAAAVYELSSKFGASLVEAADLLRAATSLGYAGGLAFHVGSQCVGTQAWRQGLDHVRDVIRASGVVPACVDVGGGFPGNYLNSPAGSMQDYLSDIALALQSLELPDTCRLLCEPGRALSCEAESLIMQLQLRKGSSIYLNDGIYGSMTEVKLGLQLPVRMVATRDFSSTTEPFRAFGPTCDSLDVYPEALELPSDIREGDWIEMGRIGAYGAACRTHFNGFYPDSFVEVESAFEAGK